mmetsp:Transcript_20413/g.78468  ORF Transcript_20413/g.78468 Transcript_20413/m.78468 type:complete len:204 (-) Transcript_20413:850-1461(-)
MVPAAMGSRVIGSTTSSAVPTDAPGAVAARDSVARWALASPPTSSSPPPSSPLPPPPPESRDSAASEVRPVLGAGALLGDLASASPPVSGRDPSGKARVRRARFRTSARRRRSSLSPSGMPSYASSGPMSRPAAASRRIMQTRCATMTQPQRQSTMALPIATYMNVSNTEARQKLDTAMARFVLPPHRARLPFETPSSGWAAP